VKTRIGSFFSVTSAFTSAISTFAIMLLVLTCGGLLQAQQSGSQSQDSPQTQSQQPPATQQQQPDQAQSADQSGGASEFVGTVVKQGDKYMFQDAASGSTYDIDHQDEVKKFEGKKVRVRGTLDPTTKTIHVQ
jgi:uncharacterized protein YdeI (BOF family)